MKKWLLASGLDFYKIVIIFVVGGFLGDVIETVFCYLKFQKWMCRSSFVYLQISAVWGLAFVLASILACVIEDRSILMIFVVGVVLGSVFEYVCSLVQEKVFGIRFWDYSKFKYNIAGRVNLQYSLGWGVATVVWIKWIFPAVMELLGRIPRKVLIPLGEGLLLLLVVDSMVSFVALKRYGERLKGIETCDRVRILIDKHFTDERMKRIYPHMKSTGQGAIMAVESVVRECS